LGWSTPVRLADASSLVPNLADAGLPEPNLADGSSPALVGTAKQQLHRGPCRQMTMIGRNVAGPAEARDAPRRSTRNLRWRKQPDSDPLKAANGWSRGSWRW
jgi:hypothetical protein